MITITCPKDGTIWTGAGVVVRATGEVLTAAHVGAKCLDQRNAQVGRLRSPYAAPSMELTATLERRIVDDRTSPTQDQVQSAEFQDLALWKIDNMQGSGLVPVAMAATFPVPGEAIEIVGFSWLPYSHRINGDAGRHAGPGLTRFRGYLTSVGAKPGSDLPFRLHYSGSTLEGVSGGPVFNERGELIGIHSTRATQFLGNLVSAGCDPTGNDGNCAAVLVPSADGQVSSGLGVNPLRLKDVLNNYSWGTSIFAVPETWLPPR